ncbi:hypothetical protein EGC86_18475 [Shewanella frigidimarina]|nr:hypothetical protein EGC86_18475 [Shewanella frigidimarina]
MNGSIGGWEIFDHIKVIAFEGSVLAFYPSIEEWEPLIQVKFTRDEKAAPGRILRFNSNEESASLEFTNWHLNEKLTMNGPHEIGQLESGEKVSLFITHQYIEEEEGIEAHSLEFQFMSGGEDEFC